MAWHFKKTPEIRSAAARLGFADPDGAAELLTPRHVGETITSAEASALARRLAGERPDLLPSEAWTKWSPAELRDVFVGLVKDKRIHEAQAFRDRHAAQLDVADGIARRSEVERSDTRRVLESKLHGSRHRQQEANAAVRRAEEALRMMGAPATGPGARTVASNAGRQRVELELATAHGEAESERQAQEDLVSQLTALDGAA